MFVSLIPGWDELLNHLVLFITLFLLSEIELVPVWMYELGLGIAYLEFRGPNSAVWMAMEFECGNWLKF
jgi:hypothetical protein